MSTSGLGGQDFSGLPYHGMSSLWDTPEALMNLSEGSAPVLPFPYEQYPYCAQPLLGVPYSEQEASPGTALGYIPRAMEELSSQTQSQSELGSPLMQGSRVVHVNFAAGDRPQQAGHAAGSFQTPQCFRPNVEYDERTFAHMRSTTASTLPIVPHAEPATVGDPNTKHSPLAGVTPVGHHLLQKFTEIGRQMVAKGGGRGANGATTEVDTEIHNATSPGGPTGFPSELGECGSTRGIDPSSHQFGDRFRLPSNHSRYGDEPDGSLSPRPWPRSEVGPYPSIAARRETSPHHFVTEVVGNHDGTARRNQSEHVARNSSGVESDEDESLYYAWRRSRSI
ncbi:unnamed protein product [Amoebophrya sp. A25]|nr:unnamed protein product [Amoebophrya sp. A25]|eukprot:GSA25T00023679001.1